MDDAFARRSDPVTSHEAAAAVEANQLEAAVLDLLRKHGVLATIEMAQLSGIPRDSLSPRMRPLERKGFVVPVGVKKIDNRRYITWSLYEMSIVNGQGPDNAQVMVVGEQPGEHEAKSGLPFHPRAAVGGQLTHYLHRIIQIHRDKCYLTNLVKSFVKKGYKITAADIEKWAPTLEEELKRVHPRLIIALGREATRYFLGDVNVEDVYGLPHVWQSNGTASVVIPTYLRMYDTDLQPLIWYSFLQAKRLLDGKIEPYQKSKLEDKDFTYNSATEPAHLDYWQQAIGGPPKLIAVDTEGLPGKPWGLSFSYFSKMATVIRVQHTAALACFRERTRDSHIILHNALYDLRILRDMGIEPKRFHDTMVMAFLIGTEPLPLKALSYRYRGIDRKSYEEVVGPTANALATEWLEKVVQEPWETIDRAPENDKNRWSIVRRIENILGSYAGRILYIGDPDKKAMTAKRKEIHKAGVRGSLKYGTVWGGWEYCIVTRPVLEKLKTITDISTIQLERRDGAKDPARRWKQAMKDHPEQADLVERHLHVVMPGHETMPEPGLDTVEEMFGDAGVKTATNYSAGDADDTWTILPILWKQVQDLKLERAYQLDIDVMPMIDRMMVVGFKVNPDYLRRLGTQLGDQVKADLADIEKTVGHPLNPLSSEQVAHHLFDELHLDVQTLTETGQRSTADDVIEALRLISEAPILGKIADYRELAKMKGTYADKLWRLLGDDGRIHPRLRITRVPSGRLACSEPNLMAIPVRSERMLDGQKLGVAIRNGFVAAEGHLLGSWDLDQIEMRILAHRSQDPNLIDIFRTGHDIHKKTASLIFNIPVEEVQPWQRTSAKSVGFGIVYGLSARGLQLQMKLRGIDRSEQECQRMIDGYLQDAYPGVRQLMEEKQREGRRDGFVRSMLGRLRYLPQLHSSNMRLRSEADRICLNHDIQTTAQEVIKLGMVGIWTNVLPAIRREGWYVEPLLQIHDELILEFDEAIAPELDVLVRMELEHAIQLAVPIGSKGHMAPSWGQLK